MRALQFNKAMRHETRALAEDYEAGMRRLDNANLTNNYVPALLKQKTNYGDLLTSIPQPSDPSPYLGDDRNYFSLNRDSPEF
jgi:hypothetical protein